MKYATQNMPNIVSLENGNEAAVRHKRTCSTIYLCSQQSLFGNRRFQKYTRKSYVFGDRLRRISLRIASVSARICRESWDESNNSIGNACYAGYRRMRVDGWLFREKNARLVSFKK